MDKIVCPYARITSDSPAYYVVLLLPQLNSAGLAQTQEKSTKSKVYMFPLYSRSYYGCGPPPPPPRSRVRGCAD